MNHVRQPCDTSCACACVAIITGERVDALVSEMKPRPKSGTRHRVLVDALRKRGVRCADRFRRVTRNTMPSVAIVRIVWPNKRGHVVVKDGRTWHDPLLDAPFTGEPPSSLEWSRGGRITSALEIYP